METIRELGRLLFAIAMIAAIIVGAILATTLIEGVLFAISR